MTSKPNGPIKYRMLIALVMAFFYSQSMQVDAQTQSLVVSRVHEYHTILIHAPDPERAALDLAENIHRKVLDRDGQAGPDRLDSLPVVPGLALFNFSPDVDQGFWVLLDLQHVEDALTSLAFWLALMDHHASLPATGNLVFAFRLATAVPQDTMVPGFAVWLPHDPPYQVAALEPLACILIDAVLNPTIVRIAAESQGRLTPLVLLDACRRVLGSAHIPFRYQPIEAFFSRIGLLKGSAVLAPWLDAGIPAIQLSLQKGGVDAILPAITTLQQPLMAVFADAISLIHTDVSHAEQVLDVNYIRYPIGNGLITLDDIDVVGSILGLLTLFCLMLAFGPLYRIHKPKALQTSAFLEALAAYMFISAAMAITHYVPRASEALLGLPSLHAGLPLRTLVVAALLRMLATVFMFFAISGMMEGFGWIKAGDKTAATRAAGLILGLLAFAIQFKSLQGTLFLVIIMAFITLAGMNKATSILAGFAVFMVALPLAGYFLAMLPSFILSTLTAGDIGILVLAAIAAPPILWLVNFLSGRLRISRGRLPAPYLGLTALLIGTLEPVLRSLSGG
jgi:hypothetical protein